MDTQAEGTQETYKEATKGGKSSEVKLWLDVLEVSSAEEEDWRKQGQLVEDLYLQQSANKTTGERKKFNILHSNIETLVPALYNSTPSPDVRRRFNDPDPIGKAVADILERALSYSVDDYDFDHVMNLGVKDAELPGRAVVRVRYKPYVKDDAVAYQEVTCEYVPWKQFRRGPGKDWTDVSWIAFQHFLTRDQLVKLAPDLGGKVTLDVTTKVNNDKNDGQNTPDVFKRAEVWEIWDKDQRKVIFIACSMKDQPLREDEDPLDLDNFFPIPRPIYSISTGSTLVPTVPYDIYRSQAEELERISERIQVLTEAVKARSIYDARLTSEMQRLESAEDTDSIPLENTAIFTDGSKLADHIAWYPLDTIVAALEKCYEAREQIKATIYEITGISDILRGQSVASETATAQNIKQQWGSLRIQAKQAEIQRFARDLFCLKAEIFASKFEPQVLSMMTGIDLSPNNPQSQAIIQLLRSDKMRGYRVDIESDSTIRADLTRNQQNMTQFLQGTAQFAQAMGPIVMTFKGLTPAVMEVFSAFARNFRLGKQAEDALDAVGTQAQQLAQQQQQQPNPEMQMHQAELAQQQQVEAAKLQQTAQLHQQKLGQDQQQFEQKQQFEREKHANEMELKAQELSHDSGLRVHEINTDAALQHHEINTDAHLENQKQATDAHLTQQKQTADTQVKREAIAAKPKTNGKASPAASARQSADFGGVAAAFIKAAHAMENAAEAMSADRELVKDPKTGKLLGSRRKASRPTIQ